MDTKYYTKRISEIPTSIFSTMSKMAMDYNAVNLGQGFPDFDGPQWLMDEAYKAMRSGKNQYAPSNGTLSLRTEVQKQYKKQYDMDFDLNKEITVTAGATEALFSTINALVEEGDEVIMFEPYYDAYQSDVILAGGTPVYVTLHKPDFHLDIDELERAISGRTKMIIINNPHNPTGKVFTKNELEAVAALAIKHDLLIVSDEVYEFLTFDNEKHTPMITLPEMKERTISISSTGKTFGMTGWKIGFAIANPNLTNAVQKVHQWTAFAVNTPGQIAMAYGFSRLEEYLPEFRELYQSKRDFLFTRLKDSAFKPHLPKGSYFMMVDIPANKNIDDIKCAEKLVKEFGVATIPPSVFYSKSAEGHTMLRLCFAKKEKTLKQGVEKLLKF